MAEGGDDRDLGEKKERSREAVSIVLKLHSRITTPGIPSDWLLLTVDINTFSVCLKASDAYHGECVTRA